MSIDKKAAGALGGCETVEEVNQIFEMFNITELSDKIEHVIAAMGSPDVYMVPGDGKDESRHDTILAAFLTEIQRKKSEDE